MYMQLALILLPFRNPPTHTYLRTHKDEIENHVTGPESLLWMNELWEMFPSDNHRRGKDQHATTTDVMKAKPKSEEEDLEGMITKDSLVPAFEGLAIAGTASKVATGVEGKDGEGTTTTPAPPLNAAGLKLGALHDSRPEGKSPFILICLIFPPPTHLSMLLTIATSHHHYPSIRRSSHF